MTQASEQIAQQYASAALNKKNWGDLTYNVLVEGLTGDGVTDDTVALQTLVNKAIAAGRKAIFFPHGTYKVTALTNANQVVFFGDNASFVGGYQGRIWQLGNDDLWSAAGISRQALINGNFDVAQRGTSFTNPSNNQYLLDRWVVFWGPAGGVMPTTITHSQQPLVDGEIPNSWYYARLNANGAGSGFGATSFYAISQKMERVTRYICGAGRKITVSFFARSSIAGKRIGVGFQQSYGTGGSPSPVESLITSGQIINLSTIFTKYTLTFTTNTLNSKVFGTNNDDFLQLNFFSMWGTSTATSNFGGGTAETFVGSGNIDIAQVQVNAGDTALPFQPRRFAEELALCQRYYEKSYDHAHAPGTVTTSGAEQFRVQATGSYTIAPTLRFKVRKRISLPTVVLYSTNGPSGKWRVNAATDVSAFIYDNCESGFGTFVSGSWVQNDAVAFHYIVDAEL